MNTAVDFDVPVYLLLGHHDCNCSFELAEKWFDKLDAPSKKLIWFENSAHSPQWEEPAKWNAEFRRLFAYSSKNPENIAANSASTSEPAAATPSIIS